MNLRSFLKFNFLFSIIISPAVAVAPRADSLSLKLDKLFRSITERRIDRREAQRTLSTLHHELIRHETAKAPRNEFRYAFPLRGYGPRHIGGARGEGHVGEESYDFFHGNAHKGHPAQDIFVFDRDRDSRDDRTRKSIDVVGVADGIIVSVTPKWTRDSLDAEGKILRGGCVVWLYEPARDRLWYFAHLDSIFVKAGERVTRSQRIATIGRTGANASKDRSPTHLHVMLLDWNNDRLRPLNCYALFVANER